MLYIQPFRFARWCSVMVALMLACSGRSPAADNDPADSAPAQVAPGQPTSQMFPLGDFGSDEMAYLAVPATAPSVGIVLVPDAYGLDDFTRLEANRLAAQGYIVLALDIYNSHRTTDPGDLAILTANLNAGSVMKTMDAGIRLFHDSPSYHVDHIVALGWGVGATYVFQAARENKTLDGAVTFYGPVITRDHVVGKFAAPLCALYPQDDPVATRQNVLDFQQAMKAAGNDCEAWFIAARSGWSNPQSKTYNPAEDKEAWKVALPFLIRIGAEPVKPKHDSIIDKAKDKIEKIFQ
jgi:carboxymethylenebutenolidase